MSRILLLLTLLLTSSLSLHLSPTIHSPSIGWISPDGTQWDGYNPDCQLLCTQAEGQTCETYPRTCCEKDSCIEVYGIKTCTK